MLKSKNKLEDILEWKSSYCTSLKRNLTILAISLSFISGSQSAYALEQLSVQYVSNTKQDNKGSIDIASKEIDPERKQQLLEEYGLESERPSNSFQGGDFGFSVSDNPNQDTLVMYLLKLLLSFIKSL